MRKESLKYDEDNEKLRIISMSDKHISHLFLAYIDYAPITPILSLIKKKQFVCFPPNTDILCLIHIWQIYSMCWQVIDHNRYYSSCIVSYDHIISIRICIQCIMKYYISMHPQERSYVHPYCSAWPRLNPKTDMNLHPPQHQESSGKYLGP